MRVDQEGNILRTILYYPTIIIPHGNWLRQAIMFWDEVASIVPEGMDYLYTPEINFLHRNRIFRPIRPDTLMRSEGGWEKLEEFEEELKKSVLADGFEQDKVEMDLNIDGIKVGLEVEKV